MWVAGDQVVAASCLGQGDQIVIVGVGGQVRRNYGIWVVFSNPADEGYVVLCLVYVEIASELWSQEYLLQLSQQGRTHNHHASLIKHSAERLATSTARRESGDKHAGSEHCAGHSVLTTRTTGGMKLRIGQAEPFLVAHSILPS